jgi:hypothetical protein
MAEQHVVVDGSNIATEGRSLPSLAQLEEAVTELRREMPEATVTVVVDATFAHRIDPAERDRFEQAALRSEYVYPPAGAIGRGDAFLLRIAERVDAIVLSNDSFQEFHGEHPWLFERGRLLGATPVPGIGWIFVPRTPVRGPKSRVAVRDATRSKQKVERAIAEATRAVVAPEREAEPAVAGAPGRRRRNDTGPQAVNDPTTFITFIAEHRLGEVIPAEVESFTSHGAVVRDGDLRGYIPLSGLGSPPPRSAREVLRRGETRSFVITALDPFRRGVEMALPEVAVVSGRPSEETVAAEKQMARRVSAAAPAAASAEAPAGRAGRRGAKRHAPGEQAPELAGGLAVAAPLEAGVDVAAGAAAAPRPRRAKVGAGVATGDLRTATRPAAARRATTTAAPEPAAAAAAGPVAPARRTRTAAPAGVAEPVGAPAPRRRARADTAARDTTAVKAVADAATRASKATRSTATGASKATRGTATRARKATGASNATGASTATKADDAAATTRANKTAAGRATTAARAAKATSPTKVTAPSRATTARQATRVTTAAKTGRATGAASTAGNARRARTAAAGATGTKSATTGGASVAGSKSGAATRAGQAAAPTRNAGGSVAAGAGEGRPAPPTGGAPRTRRTVAAPATGDATAGGPRRRGTAAPAAGRR